MNAESKRVLPQDANVLDVDLDERHGANAGLPSISSFDRSSSALPSVWNDVTRISSSTSPSSHTSEPLRFFDGYEVLEELARGGMGVVYRARRLADGRLVAVKMILSGQFAGEGDLRRFRSEWEAVSRLNHPGIVPIYDVGECQGRPYFSMELVEGRSLADLVELGPMGPREAAAMVRRIAEAVHYAHERGVIHRDLKPKNILLDASGAPKITDFGLAKRLNHDDNLTQTGEVVGTPSYMPPEQAEGDAQKTGPASDVYSLGAMLYCLLTGRPPFLAPSWMDTLLQVREKEPAPPSLLQPTIPKSLEAICLKCLEKDPADRYQSAHALAADLAHFLSNAPTEARAPARRRRARLALLTNLVFVASLSLAAGTIVYAAWNVTTAVNEARDFAARAMRNAQEAERRAAAAERRATEAERRAEAVEAVESMSTEPQRTSRRLHAEAEPLEDDWPVTGGRDSTSFDLGASEEFGIETRPAPLHDASGPA